MKKKIEKDRKLNTLVKKISFGKTSRAFKPYIELFEILYGSEVVTPIVFVDIPKESAPCVGMYVEGKGIVIDRAFWKRSSKVRRQLLIFHELGHGELGICRHTKRPYVSIMNATIPLDELYLDYEDKLIEDLLSDNHIIESLYAMPGSKRSIKGSKYPWWGV